MTESSPVFVGQCLCGEVAYSAKSPAAYQIVCICTQCQAIGGGYGVGSFVLSKDSFRVDKGAEHIQEFRVPGSAAGVVRSFCRNCGTHITACNEGHPFTAINAGTVTVTEDVVFKPQVAIWCQSKRPHHCFPSDLPQFPQYPPK